MSGTDRLGPRYYRKVVPGRCAAMLAKLFGKYNAKVNSKGDERVAYGTMHRFLNEVNLHWYREYDEDVKAIMEQIFNRTKYMRIDEHGPKAGEITVDNPLTEPYFTRLDYNETTKQHDVNSLALANNGWVWAADVMKDNAGASSKVYLRRELIVWVSATLPLPSLTMLTLGRAIALSYGMARDHRIHLSCGTS